MSSNSQEPSILHLQINKNHLVKTGFMDKYNELMLTTVFNAYVDTDTNMLTLQRENGDICIPFSLSGLPDVEVDNASSGDVLTYNGTAWVGIAGGGEIFDYVRTEPSTRHTDILSVSSLVDAVD